MIPLLPNRTKLVGWVNVALGLALPIALARRLVLAAQIHPGTPWYTMSNIVVPLLVMLGLAGLMAVSGRALLKERRSGPWVTSLAASLLLGYSGWGILLAAKFAYDEGGMGSVLKTLKIPFGVFAPPLWVEVALAGWWVFCFRWLYKNRSAGASPDPAKAKPIPSHWAVFVVLLGGAVRWIELGYDFGLMSQRG